MLNYNKNGGIMLNIKIICDSSVSLTEAQCLHYNVAIAPLTLIHNNQSYEDQISISQKEVNDLLRNHEVVRTAQPNLGTLYRVFEEVTATNPDYIIALSIGTALSGTFNAMNLVVEDLNLKNAFVLNTHSIAGPVQQGVKLINELNQEGQPIEVIIQRLVHLFENQVSYIYPHTLDQVIASGRLSKTAATVANFLKIKPVLYLENQADKIEKLGVARHERRAFRLLVDHLTAHDIAPETHDLYLLHSEGLDTLERLKTHLNDALGTFDCNIVDLPAAVATHAGLGTVSLQWCLKIK